MGRFSEEESKSSLTSKIKTPLMIACIVGALLTLIFCLFTVGMVNPAHGEFYIWRNDTGAALPPGQIIADKGEAGVTREMWTQGWKIYFGKNIWWTLQGPEKVTNVGTEEVCTLVQHTGRPLPEGMLLAPVKRDPKTGEVLSNDMGLPESEYMGMLDVLLGPGQYRIHPKMYTATPQPWFSVASNQLGTLTQLDGEPLPEGMLLAPVDRENDGKPKLNDFGLPYSRYKGMLDEYLGPGRYRVHPGKYKSELAEWKEVRAGEVAVLIKRDGKPLPEGEFIAPITDKGGKVVLKDGIPQSDYKGVLKEVLKPGQYRIHPGRYDFVPAKAVTIEPGEVGVLTALTGLEKPEGNLLAEEGQRGVQKKVLASGTYYLNPHMYRVDKFSLQSQLTEFLKDNKADTFDEIDFPSNEGFNIAIDVAVEWRVDSTRVPEVFVRLGNIQDLQHKIVVPNTRSIARTEGSKYSAKQFIQGKTREEFEKSFFEELKEVCAEKGVQVLRGVVRKLTVPEQISDPIRMAELARQEVLRNEEQVKSARSAAAKMEEETRIGQRKSQIDAETKKLVAEMDASQRLAVAKIDLDTAKQEAEATKTRGDGEAHVIFAKKKAEADGIRIMTEAFGGGESLAMFEMAKAISQNTVFAWIPSNEGTLWGAGGGGITDNLTQWMFKNQRKETTEKKQEMEKPQTMIEQKRDKK